MKRIKFIVTTILLSIFFSVEGIAFEKPKDKSVIYVYKDEGVSNESLKHTLHMLGKLISDKYEVATLKSKALI
jgi:biotin protein ligase-like protein